MPIIFVQKKLEDDFFDYSAIFSDIVHISPYSYIYTGGII